MTLIIRKSKDRGHLNHGWLDTYHTFSFGEYYDSRHMGYRSLRVINEDYVKAGYGFDMHPHKNMEILTYVISGALTHQDSMGTKADVTSGNIQIMSAGSGITHSEVNNSGKDVHLLQIWILPDKLNIKPRHDEGTFTRKDKLNKLCLLASNLDDNYKINQDVKIYASILEKENEIECSIAKGRGLWIQVISGELKINGEEILKKGDGCVVENINKIDIEAISESEFLLFDLA
jgi:hypothetical protein